MSSSVVLSTYNGERWVRAQLDSLYAQTVRPDEVLIRDDGSLDATAQIIADYIDEHGFSSWVLDVGGPNLGWKRSFHDIIMSARGDYIFPCDQDDVWFPEKIGMMVRLMDVHPEIDLLACSVEAVYEDGSQKVSSETIESNGDVEDALHIEEMGPRFMYIRRPGCTYCVRRAFVEQVEPYWNPDWPHDAVLWRCAAVKGTLGLLDKRLVRFRRHANNASMRKGVDKSVRLGDVCYYADNIAALMCFSTDVEAGHEKVQILHDMERWLDARIRYLEGRQRVRSLVEMVLGNRFYTSWRGFAVDVMLGLVPSIRFC